MGFWGLGFRGRGQRVLVDSLEFHLCAAQPCLEHPCKTFFPVLQEVLSFVALNPKL